MAIRHRSTDPGASRSNDSTAPSVSSSPLADWPRPLAFVLSGAGAFGSVQVGMLRALEEHGVRPDLVVGSSAGALNGVMLSADPAGAVERLSLLWRRMSRQVVFGHGWWGAARCLARTGHLSRLDHLAAIVDDHLGPDTDFESLMLPFAAVATNAVSGEPELLTSGQLKLALLASSAVPGIFPPVEIGGQRYLDGGIAANVPIRQAIAFGAASVIALDATPAVPSAVPCGLIPGLLHTVSLIVRNQRSHAVEDLAHRYPILVLPSVTPPDIGAFNFALTDELLERSYERSLDALDVLGAPIPAGPASGVTPDGPVPLDRTR